MEISRNNLKTIAIISILVISSMTVFANFAITRAEAQALPVQTSGPLPAGVTANFTVKSQAYLSVRPTVIGLNQIFLVNLFPIPAPDANRKFLDFKVTITKPDGKTEVLTMDSYVADGTQWFEYVADQLGTWKFKFEMPGQYFPAARYLDGNIVATGGTSYTLSTYYQPSSTPERTITVVQDMVASYPPAALPTDYWTRPVPYEKREWWPVIGDYPWRGTTKPDTVKFAQYNPDTNPYWGGYELSGMGGPWRGHFTPWVQGPNTAHVAWKEQYTIAGIIGGDWETEIYDANIFGNSGYGRFPEIVLAGRAYMTAPKPGSGTQSIAGGNVAAQNYLRCYDYRTGELIWERPLEAGESGPTVIEYTGGLLPGGAVSGVHEHVTAVNLLAIGGGALRKYNPWTGASSNYSIAPLTTGTYYVNGYALSVQDLGAAAGANRYRLINWTTLGSSSSLASRIQSNITWPWNSLPQTTNYGSGVSVMVQKSMVGGAPNMTRVMAANLKTGVLMWDVALTEWSYSTNTVYVDHGKVAILTEQGYFIALSETTGQTAWKSEKFDFPWDEPGFGGYNVLSAYGLLYRNGYSGIYAFDWDDGKIAWKYEAISNPFETPYVSEDGKPTFSWNIGAGIADGKYYAYNTEHSATVPITRGWQLHCINATTGEGIWKVGLPGASSKHTVDIGPIADGYMTVGSSDGYTYAYGKGKSATTVAAPDVVIQKGTGVVIKGTVLDLSPAQPNTPCVSKDSMALQMEYLHKQMPIDGLWHNGTITGVTVMLTAISSDGNSIDIGTVTTNGYYGTFSKSWTPPSEGDYEIIASFAGDDSYGSSAASTALSVGPAAEQTQIPEQVLPQDYTMTIISMGIAIIIVVLVVGVILFLRKK